MVLLVYGNGLRKAHGFEMHEMSMAWRVFFFIFISNDRLASMAAEASFYVHRNGKLDMQPKGQLILS